MSLLLMAARARMNHIVAVSNYATEVLLDSPLAYWRLNDTSGANIVDASGNGQTGTYFGSPTLGEPSLLTNGDGTAVKFAGNTQYAQLPSLGNTVGDFTAELWFKTSSSSGGQTGDAFSRSDETYASDSLPAGVFLDALGGGVPRLGLRIANSGSFVSISVPNSITNDVPHHLVFTRNATTGVCNIYVDGALAKTGTLATGVINLNSSSHWWMRSCWVGSAGFFRPTSTATADEAAIYDHVLSAARIAAHYAAGT